MKGRFNHLTGLTIKCSLGSRAESPATLLAMIVPEPCRSGKRNMRRELNPQIIAYASDRGEEAPAQALAEAARQKAEFGCQLHEVQRKYSSEFCRLPSCDLPQPLV